MKKSTSLYQSVSFVLCLIAILVFSVCPSEGSGVQPSEPAKPEFILKAGHVADEQHSLHQGYFLFEEYVERESKGRIACEMFGNGVLGGDREHVEAIELGVIQLGGPATTVLVSYVPEFGVLDMPFLFSSPEAGFKALDNELGKHLDKLLLDKVGVINLGYGFNGIRSVSNKVRPIKEPADMEGLKIRVMESPIYIDTFEALGANPTPMSFGEVFTALQQGTVDGQDNGAQLTYSARFYEVQDYFTETGHTLSYLPIIINKDFFESLPADLQEIVRTGARLYMVEEQRKIEIAQKDEAVRKMVEAGVQVDTITPENYKKFVDAVQSVYDKNVDTVSPELVKMARMYNE